MKSGQYTREIPQRYRLEVAKCDGCGKVHFPPRLVCNECNGRNFTNTVLPKNGKIVTFTNIHVGPPNFSLQEPFVVAIVEMTDGTRLTCQVTDCDAEEVEIGASVEMVFRKIQEDTHADIIQYGYKAILER